MEQVAAAAPALLVLAHLRNGDTYASLAAGFGIGVATVHRYITEVVDVLATLGPILNDAIHTARGKVFVILDGTLVAIDRVHYQRPCYSGKHKRHGVNVQVLADPAGRLIWASPALPGSMHDLTAARRHGLIAALTYAAIATFADKAISVPTEQWVPCIGAVASLATTRVSTVTTRGSAVSASAAATPKAWRVLTKIRCSPHRISRLLAAILTLHHTPM